MKIGKFFKFFVKGIAFTFLLISCSEDYLDSPVRSDDEGTGSALISDTLDSPTEVTASHGKKETISLQWKSVKGAVRYQIYVSDSPYAEYVQAGESRETYYDYKTASGKNKYFKVAAVNYVHTKSKDSNTAFGSTLATPLITSIEPSSNGLGATVKWWMSNCSDSTYKNDLNYDVFAYSEDLKTVVSSAKAEKGETSVFLEGLSPKTNYKFEVQAYIQSDQNTVEKSDMVDEETARRLVPAAPEKLTVSKGEFADKIQLEWVLPDYVDVALGNKTYETHGIYFSIFRKKKGSDDSEYEFLTKVNPPNYTPGEKTSYSDTGIEAGIQYVYKVQSFTADVAKEISSETSVAEEEGWEISAAKLRVEGNYKNEDKIFTSINFNFKVEFESFGVDYTYFVKEQRLPLTGEETFSPVFYKFEKIEQITAFVRNFENLNSAEGYYTYALLLYPAGTETADSNVLLQTVAPGKFIVTADSDRLPVISGFEVKDKFKDKFIVSWDYNSDYAYTLNWIDGDSNENSISFEKDDSRLKIENGKAEYLHEALSGETRIYTLEATNGLSASTTDDTVYETLGTAKPEFKSPDYDRISFTWKKVQAADSSLYKVKAYYSDDAEKKELLPVYEIKACEDEKIECVIEKPEGWDNPDLAGKEVTVEIVATNATGDETKSSDTTRLLGPANAKTKVTTQTANDICVSWNVNTDASGYIIYRKAFSDGKGTKEEGIDEIYVSSDGTVITVEDEAVNTAGCVRAEISRTDGVITFKDKYAEPSNDTSKYQVNQSKLAWGLPFGYFVVPVKDAGDRPVYANSEFAKGATFGYGLNVKASKAEDSTTVKITWEQPYNARSKSASLYRRKAGSTESNWVYCSVLGKSDAETLTAEDVIGGIDVKLNAWEYAVLYNGTHANGKIFAASYEKDLASENKRDTESILEQANKGYTLALADISAMKGDGYDEVVSWSSWNYSERNSGPDYYELQVKNLNKGADWVTVGKITPDVKIIDGELKIIDEGKTVVPQNILTSGIASLTADICSATITPEFAEGVSDGMLKVLRDARHFYRLVAYKTLGDGSVAEASTGDDKVFVYREITEKEFVRCVNLVIADALYKSGIPYKTVNGETTKTVNGKEGTFSITGGPVSAFNYKNKVKWCFTGYSAGFNNGLSSGYSNDTESFITLNSAESSYSEVGIDGNAVNYSSCQLYYLPALDISVTSQIPLNSYKGTVNVTIGESGTDTVWKMTAKLNGSEVLSASDEEEFYKWFPYQLGSTVTSSYDIDSSFKIYQSPWWE